MIEFSILGSGSGGNAALVRSGGAVLLVDAGLSARELGARMATMGVSPGDLCGIVLTHEHGDHARGLGTFLKRHRVPVLATGMTRAVLRDAAGDGVSWRTMPGAGFFAWEGFEIETFAVPHDAVEPVGFVIGAGGVKLGVLSDLGHVTPALEARVGGVDALFVEANYDPDMLARDTKRPWSTRQRIAGRHGHLSNEQTAALLKAVGRPELQRVVLGHLSRDCNAPELACAAAAAALAAHGGIPVSCAAQHEPTPWHAIMPRARALPAAAPTSLRQAELF